MNLTTTESSSIPSTQRGQIHRRLASHVRSTQQKDQRKHVSPTCKKSSSTNSVTFLTSDSKDDDQTQPVCLSSGAMNKASAKAAKATATGRAAAIKTSDALNQNENLVQHDYHDHSSELVQDGDISKLHVIKPIQGGVTETFPVKLHRMLNQIEKEGSLSQHIVSWQPHGRAFIVRDSQKFVTQILRRYFTQSKMSSFQRQLNLYGFSRITCGRDKGSYYHEYFLKGSDYLHLLKHMRLVKVKGTKIRKSSNPATEPNFYAMSFIPISRRGVGAAGGGGEHVVASSSVPYFKNGTNTGHESYSPSPILQASLIDCSRATAAEKYATSTTASQHLSRSNQATSPIPGNNVTQHQYQQQQQILDTIISGSIMTHYYVPSFQDPICPLLAPTLNDEKVAKPLPATPPVAPNLALPRMVRVPTQMKRSPTCTSSARRRSRIANSDYVSTAPSLSYSTPSTKMTTTTTIPHVFDDCNVAHGSPTHASHHDDTNGNTNRVNTDAKFDSSTVEEEEEHVNADDEDGLEILSYDEDLDMLSQWLYDGHKLEEIFEN